MGVRKISNVFLVRHKPLTPWIRGVSLPAKNFRASRAVPQMKPKDRARAQALGMHRGITRRDFLARDRPRYDCSGFRSAPRRRYASRRTGS
jgi:hypothetical protein